MTGKIDYSSAVKGKGVGKLMNNLSANSPNKNSMIHSSGLKSGGKIRLLDEISSGQKMSSDNSRLNTATKRAGNFTEMGMSHSNSKLRNLASVFGSGEAQNGLSGNKRYPNLGDANLIHEIGVKKNLSSLIDVSKSSQHNSGVKDRESNVEQPPTNSGVLWDMFVQSGKSPIVMLSDFATKINKKIRYDFDTAKLPKKQIY